MATPAHVAAASPGAIHRYFEVSLFFLLLASVLALVTTGKLDLPSSVLPLAALLFKAVRYWRGCTPEISSRGAAILIVLYVLCVPADLWIFSRGLAQGAPNAALYSGLLTTVHLLLFAMVVRLFSARVTRDYVFLAVVSVALMLAAAILTVDTAFLVFFLLFLVLTVSTFASLEMRRSAEAAAGVHMAAGSRAGRRLYSALRVTSLGVAASALVLGTTLFFLIPRFHAGYLSAYTLQPTLITGFDDDAELGHIGAIKRSDAVVMRVRIEEGPALGTNLRWRGLGLATFDGRRWYTPPHERYVISADPAGWHQVGESRSAQNRRWLQYTVLLEPMESDAVFVAAHPVMLRGSFTGQVERLGRQRRGYLLYDQAGSLANPYHNYTKVLYQARSLRPEFPPELLRKAGTEYPAEIMQTYGQLPALDPRIAELASQITAPAASPYEKALALEAYLRTRFGYTLEQPAPLPADPLAAFLFERRRGHCEYFATAMAVMLRTLGIPSRYVKGFLAGEYNDVGDDFIVRAADAHTWVEVYFPGLGWVEFDPTPPSDAAGRGWLGRLAYYWDWFELMWSEWVINYDAAHQETFAQGLLRRARDWTAGAQALLSEKHEQALALFQALQKRGLLGYALPALLAALLVLGLVLRRELRERLAARWGWFGARPAPARLATLLYEQMLRLLRRRGLEKRPGQTPAEFAAAIRAPELALPVAQFTSLYQAARFGGRGADPRQMTGLLDAIRAALRKHR